MLRILRLSEKLGILKIKQCVKFHYVLGTLREIPECALIKAIEQGLRSKAQARLKFLTPALRK